MRSLKRLRIFEDDCPRTPESDPRQGRHRVSLNVSNLSTRYECSKIISLSPFSRFDHRSQSTSDISDEPLNELLFSPIKHLPQSVCDDDHSLFKDLMTASKTAEPQSHLKYFSGHSTIQIDVLVNHRHSTSEPNSSLKPFIELPIKKTPKRIPKSGRLFVCRQRPMPKSEVPITNSQSSKEFLRMFK
jgi:hypothetical protein